MEEIYVVGVALTRSAGCWTGHQDADRRSGAGGAGRRGPAQGGSAGRVLRQRLAGHMDGQQMIRGQIALREAGIGRVPVVNVENACASGSSRVCAGGDAGARRRRRCCAGGGGRRCSRPTGRRCSRSSTAPGTCRAPMRSATVCCRWGMASRCRKARRRQAPTACSWTCMRPLRAHMRRWGTTQRRAGGGGGQNHAHSVHNSLSQYRTSPHHRRSAGGAYHLPADAADVLAGLRRRGGGDRPAMARRWRG